VRVSKRDETVDAIRMAFKGSFKAETAVLDVFHKLEERVCFESCIEKQEKIACELKEQQISS
jgi:hypothetical protein